jgi:hypothetical protein
MNNSPTTLNHFFLFNAQNLAQEKLASLESSEMITALRESLSQKARGITWPVAFDNILQGIKELLDVRLEDILVAAWNTTRELAKYHDPEKYAPNETVLVHLVEHTINSQLHPALEVLINDIVVEKIDFIIKLALSFQGIILKIKEGKIKEIMPGSCKGKGKLSLGNFDLIEEETKTFILPRSINLGEGIPI